MYLKYKVIFMFISSFHFKINEQYKSEMAL